MSSYQIETNMKPPFIDSFIHLHIHLFIYTFIYYFTLSFIHLHIHLFIHRLVHSFTNSFIYLLNFYSFFTNFLIRFCIQTVIPKIVTSGSL